MRAEAERLPGVRVRQVLGFTANALLIMVPALAFRAPLADLVVVLSGSAVLCAVDLAFEARASTVFRITASIRSSHFVDSALGAAVLLTIWLALATGGPSTWLMRAAGAVMVSVAFALRLAAHRALGAQFQSGAVVTDGGGLVTSKIFSRMRHPSDAGIALFATGCALACASVWAAVAALAAVIPLTLLRAHLDDRVLACAFGDEHGRYRRRVPAFFPRLFSLQ